MRQLILFFLLIPFLTVAQTKPSAKAPKGFTITADIVGMKSGTTVKISNANTGEELATSTVQEKKLNSVKNGKTITSVKSSFVLKGTIAEPDLCHLIIGDSKPFNLYTENSNIKITGKIGEPANWNITGSSSHKDFREFETTFTPLAQLLNSTAASINALGAGQQRDSLMQIYSGTQLVIQNKIDEYIQRKKSSYVSPFVLLVMMNFNNDPIISEGRFNKLDSAVRVSYLGKVLANQIAESKIGAVGTLALDFTQSDTSGNPVSLSSFRGKYVLIDFWASWCGPCRTENPNVVYNYQKFREKNFTVLGVSLDRPGQKDKWVKAIQDDSLTWTHVSDLKWWDNEVAKMYLIRGIPQNFLIDPQGKIIAKNLRGPALEAKLCEVLGCN